MLLQKDFYIPMHGHLYFRTYYTFMYVYVMVPNVELLAYIYLFIYRLLLFSWFGYVFFTPILCHYSLEYAGAAAFYVSVAPVPLILWHFSYQFSGCVWFPLCASTMHTCVTINLVTTAARAIVVFSFFFFIKSAKNNQILGS